MPIPIEVKDGNNKFKVVATIIREPQQAKGWEWVRYQGRRYQLFGMVRTPYFIDIANPIKKLAKRAKLAIR